MKRFAIVGCGTGGLAAAIQLARAGHDVSIFERFPEPSAVGAGILIQPSGALVLRQLGLLDALELTAARIDALDGRLASGKRIMDVVYSNYAPGVRALGAHRANLLAILNGAAVAAGVKIHCASEVEAIDRKSPEISTLRFSDGRESEPFDAVVLANGTQSRLRELLPVPQSCRPYPWGALWSVFPLERGDPLPNALLQRYRSASVMIGLMPTGVDPVTGNPCASFFWSLRRAHLERWRETPLDEWKAEVLEHWPEIGWVLERFVSKDQLAFAGYADVRMRRWHDGNVVVIGDAAHAMSPQLGQGANLALIDAACLSDCLRETDSIAAAFAEYTKRRRRHLRFYQAASRCLTPMFQSDSRIAAWLRDFGFPLANRMSFTRREAVRTVAGLKTGLLLDRSVTEGLEREPGASLASASAGEEASE